MEGLLSKSNLPSTLFKTSAVLNLVSVPGHIVFGRQKLEPFLEDYSYNPALGVSIAAARVGWSHMTVSIITAAALNWHWSSSGGPELVHEQIIFWSVLVSGAYVGAKYWREGEYAPLACLWVAPLCSLVAWVLNQRKDLDS
ncbi:hypothetical protein DV735_g2861, partial [Chaetothyriales sp. CBS 134920]